jgi:hypothetical protein
MKKISPTGEDWVNRVPILTALAALIHSPVQLNTDNTSLATLDSGNALKCNNKLTFRDSKFVPPAYFFTDFSKAIP